MDPVGLILIVAGIAAVAIGAFMARGPRAMIKHLDETEANLQRYEDWRGSNRAIEADGPTGADIMRQQMRQRLYLWVGLIVAGIAAIVLGFFVG